MYKRIIAIILATILAISVPIVVFADESILTRKTLKVVKIADTGDYVYFPEYYSAEAQLMPVSKGFLARFSSMSPMGYADKNGKIIIPINNDWTYAGKFTNGLAVIYDSKKKCYSAINTTGKVVFDFDNDTALSGVGDSFYFQILEKDPNGMYYACVVRNGNSITKTDHPTLTIYDAKGKRIKKELPFYRIGMFHNGVANLYNLENTHITGYIGGSPIYSHDYKAVASINTKGEIFDYPVEEYEVPTSDNTFGFSVERGDNFLKVIKNSKGKEIYRYTNDSYFDGHYFINEKALLVPVKQKDGTTAHTLMDSNGNLYHEYQFNNHDGFGGSYGNRFIIRPYKSFDEKVAYAKKSGAEGEDWLHRTTYMAEGKDLIIYDLQPYTIYEVQEITENAIPTSARITVNGKEYTAPAYGIRGENYLRIRDIAYMLNGTSKQFNIVYNKSDQSINIITSDNKETAEIENAYQAVGGEMKALENGTKAAVLSNQMFLVNSLEKSPLAYSIGGSIFVRLRDIGKIIGFEVTWNGETGTIVIDTNSGSDYR